MSPLRDYDGEDVCGGAFDGANFSRLSDDDAAVRSAYWRGWVGGWVTCAVGIILGAIVRAIW